MEAKNTVLQPHELQPVLYDTLLKQAEVSFRAGYAQAMRDNNKVWDGQEWRIR